MKIIAHRGGAGHALENSETAFKRTVKTGVSAIELDVRLTKDKQLVVNHDATLRRTAGDSRKIRKYTWEELQDVTLHDGSPLLLLEDALKIIKATPVVIELKDQGSTEAILKVLKQFPGANASVASFWLKEILKVKKQLPQIPSYAFALFRPIHVAKNAKKHGIEAIGFPWWCLNPLSHHFVKKLKGTSYVYTVNSNYLVHRIQKKYPDMDVCTNYPERFIVTT